LRLCGVPVVIDQLKREFVAQFWIPLHKLGLAAPRGAKSQPSDDAQVIQSLLEFLGRFLVQRLTGRFKINRRKILGVTRFELRLGIAFPFLACVNVPAMAVSPPS